MKYLIPSQTQVITVGPITDSTDGVTRESLAATVSALLGAMHMDYPSGTAPAIVTFYPTSTATYTIAGAMAEKASASGMYTLVLTATLTNWHGNGMLQLFYDGQIVPYWDNVFCGYTPVNTVQVGGATAASATELASAVMVQMNTQDYGELGQVAPSVSVPLTYKIGYLYTLARNKVETTATGTLVYDNAGTTVNHKYTLSDDGTTFTRSEAVAGT